MPKGDSAIFDDILVAVDGSAAAELALTHAIDLAEHTHSRLTLFTGIARPRPLAYWGLAAPGALSFLEHADAAAEMIARRARDRVPDHIPVTSVMTRQRVNPALVRLIDDGHHDLVVMGSNRRSRGRSAVLGGVSNYILHHSTIPVLILHAEASRQHQPAGGASAANGSPASTGLIAEPYASRARIWPPS